MDLSAMLRILATQDGSDLYLSTGAPPCAKFNGVLKPLTAEPLKAGEVAAHCRKRDGCRAAAPSSSASWK